MAIEFKEAVFLAYQVFRELSNHELYLATSLQSLAPTNKGSSTLSAQYLHDDALMLKDLSEKLKEFIAVTTSTPPSSS